MSVQSEINRISSNVTAALAAIADKGVTVPEGSNSDSLAALIAAIEAGGGGHEVTCGIITLSEDSTNISWEHGLSKAPNFGMIFLATGYSVTTYANMLRAFYKRYTFSGTAEEKFDAYVTTSPKSAIKHPNSMSNGQSAFTVNDTTVTANECNFSFSSDNMKWLAGKTYFWICIAGDIVFPYE